MNNHLASLPRKTNLASVGGRYGAAIVDFALALLLTLVLYYGGSRLVFQNTLTSLEDELYYYQVQSGLFYKTEDGEVSFYEMDDENPSYLVYAEPVEYYYLNFLTGTNIKEGMIASPSCDTPLVLDDGSEVLPRDYYTISWYNANILQIGINPDSPTDTGYFTYQKNADGEYIYDAIGVAKTTRYDADSGSTITISSEDLCYYYDDYYMAAYENLTYLSFYSEVRSSFNQFQSLALMIPVVISLVVFYLIIPLCFKRGCTVGKLAFKLGLANMDGYMLSRWRVILRPLLAIVIALIIFLFGYEWSFTIPLFLIIVPLLVSWVFTFASPKHCALHDYISQTIVIDVKTSTIYKNSLEEYIALSKEENLPIDEEVLKRENEEVPLTYDRSQYTKKDRR